MKLSVAIIAGGKSVRMGRDKAFVKLAGKPLIQHVIERSRNLDQTETILIANQPERYRHLGFAMYRDVCPNKGSLGGIYTALTYAQSPHTLVIACDMPFIKTELLRFMIAQISDDIDIVAPRVGGYPQGLHAIYSQSCRQPIQEQLAANRLKVIRFYDRMRVRYLDEADYGLYDVDGRSFVNLNTPEDLRRARQLLE